MNLKGVFSILLLGAYPVNCLVAKPPALVTNTGSDTKTTGENEIILTWENDIADRIRKEFEKRPSTSNHPYMVACVGIPGSGTFKGSLIFHSIIHKAISQTLPEVSI